MLSVYVIETGGIQLIFPFIRKDEEVDVPSDVKCQ